MSDKLFMGLTASEQRDFQYIVGRARSAGWIGDADTLTATRTTVAIQVEKNRLQTKLYVTSARWLFEFLGDLSRGWWRSAAPESTLSNWERRCSGSDQASGHTLPRD